MPVIDPTTNVVYVVVDQEVHFQAMEALRQREDIAAISRGLDDVKAGRGQSLKDAMADIHAAIDAHPST